MPIHASSEPRQLRRAEALAPNWEWEELTVYAREVVGRRNLYGSADVRPRASSTKIREIEMRCGTVVNSAKPHCFHAFCR